VTMDQDCCFLPIKVCHDMHCLIYVVHNLDAKSPTTPLYPFVLTTPISTLLMALFSLSITMYIVSLVKYFNPETNIAIIRIARDHFRLLWAAITYVVSFGSRDGMMRVVHVGGSIRSCQKHAAVFWLSELRVELATSNIS